MLQVMEGGPRPDDRPMLTRLKELAIQAADGAYSDLQRQRGIQIEADELIKELNRITVGITFNGITLFPDIESSVTFQVGETTQDKVNLVLNAVNAFQLLGQFASKVGFVKESEALTRRCEPDKFRNAQSHRWDYSHRHSQTWTLAGQLPVRGLHFQSELSIGDRVAIMDASTVLGVPRCFHCQRYLPNARS
ncbi:MAG: hypothetical protein KatS3mg115_1551 [Candidatus Poribacteria bacterium]|nr:MAG: hypothetical protein KatS3mg115_1551 [Candidatus Poribacteria bacterium]